MSAAAGNDGRCSSRSASSVVAKEVKGFHLLRIDGYSQTKKLLPGQKLSSQPFTIGGHSWRIDYYPNGRDASGNSNAISVYLQLIDNQHQTHLEGVLQAEYSFSLLDHAGIAACEVPFETGSFTSVPQVYPPSYHHHNVVANGLQENGGGAEPGPGCGHDAFITTEDLERRREHLIRDDSIVLRCDVKVTQIATSWLAHDELNMAVEDEDGYPDDQGYYAPGFSAPRRHHQQRGRPADDDEYVNWCLKQRPGPGLGRGRHR